MSPNSGSLFSQKAGKGGIPTPGWMGTGEAASQFLGASKTHWDGDELNMKNNLDLGCRENASALDSFC